MHRKLSLLRWIDSSGATGLKRFLLAAAALHLSLIIIINLVGHYKLLPRTFDSSGVGISFAVDSAEYRQYVIALVNLLKQEGVAVWVKDSSPFHVKLYSLCFALFGPLLGYTTLSAEPLNLIYYLLILALCFTLGREIFGRRVGLLSAAVVAVWPSFLLHTTQLLRDPLFIAAMLGLVLCCAVLVVRECSWKRGLAIGSAGIMSVSLVWLIRSQMWEVMLATTALTLFLIIIRQLRDRKALVGSLLGCVLLLALVLGLPQIGKRLNLYSYPPEKPAGQNSNQAPTAPNGRALPPGSGLPARVNYIRGGFIKSYPGAGSGIDTEVEFRSVWDIILYLPRAAEISLFAPFPYMWFEHGPQVGLSGRIISGLETLLMYLIEMLAVVGLWQRRKFLPAWLLLITACVGMLALGLVVPNVATLFRMRYVFWILLIPLGLDTALNLLSALFKEQHA